MSSLDCHLSVDLQFDSLKALCELSSLSKSSPLSWHEKEYRLLDKIQRSQSFIITAVFIFIMILVLILQLQPS